MHDFIVLADSTNGVAGALFGLGAFGLVLFILASLFWLWMLVDALTNSSLDSTMKLVWALVVFFFHILGALIYFFAARKRLTAA